MKVNQWTLGLAAVGLVSLPALLQAEEKLNPILTAVTPTTISGYVSTSVEWNPGTGNNSVPAFAFNKGKQDGFNLDVVSLSLDKPLDEGNWAAGYHVDLLFGPDANAFATQSSGTAADFGIKQAYVALRAPVGNGLDAKVGVFDTPIGYETFDSHKNPNYTRSYGYTIEPTTHTGILLSYQLCKLASVSAGIANTFGPKINERARTESYKTYMGSLALTAPDDWGFLAGSSLSACVINGFNSGTAAGGVNQTSYYVGAAVNTPLKWLKVGASFDELATTDHTYGPGADTSWYGNAYGIYASMTVNEKLSVHLRGEYATTDTALFGQDPAVPTVDGGSKMVAATATVQYDLWKNVLSRLEFRWDHVAGDNEQTRFGGTPAPGGAGTPGHLRNYYTIALNLIYKF
ncbi:MAG: hypothetical protein QOF48_2333 [Verrucomicrobiota bacterium]|jgi:hypothetical protein